MNEWSFITFVLWRIRAYPPKMPTSRPCTRAQLGKLKMSETKEGNEMKSFLKVAAMILVISATMFASNPNGATATNTVSGSVALQVSVNTAVRLSFAAGATTVNGGAACALGGSVVVGSASDVSFNLGTVDGLGLSAPTCGGLVAAVAVGGTSATYATSYKITPEWSGFVAAAAANTVLTSAGFTNSATLTPMEGSTAAGMTAVPTSGTTHAIATAAAGSGVTVERFIGVNVLNNNGGAASRFPNKAAAGPFAAGADAALITYTMTLQ